MAGAPPHDLDNCKTGQYPGISGYDYRHRRGPSGSLQRMPRGYCASEYSLTGLNDEQLQHNTALAAEIARLRRELDLALNQVLSETRREAAHKQAALDDYSAFGKALIYLGAALDGAWESIEGMGKLFYDIALQIGLRANPLTGARVAAEDAKRMHAFVEATRQRVQDLDISRRDLQVFFLVITDQALHKLLLKFAGDYFDALHGVDKVRMAAAFAPDLILILLTGGIGLAVSTGSKLRHLNRIRGLLLKLGDLLRKVVGRMKTPRRKRLGSGNGSTGSSAGAQTPSQLRKPASANSNGKPNKEHGSSSEGNEGKIGAKNKPEIRRKIPKEKLKFKPKKTSVSLPRERFWDIQVAKIDSPTRQLLGPDRPASVPLRHALASSALASHHSLNWLDGVSDVTLDPLWRSRTTGIQSYLRLSGSTSPRVRSPWLAAEETHQLAKITSPLSFTIKTKR